VCQPAPNAGNQPDCYRGWPQGYCTEPCSATVFCSNTSAICAGICLAPCDATLPCASPPGTYVCDFNITATFGLNYGVCVPACSSNQDCTNFWTGDGGLLCDTTTHQCCGTSEFECCPNAPQCTGPDSSGTGAASVCNTNINTCT